MLKLNNRMRLRQSDNRKKNILLLLVVGTFCLNLLALLLMVFNSSMLQQLSHQLTPQVLVELRNGRAINADPEMNQERQSATIRRFVGETLNFLLTTSPQQPPSTIWQVGFELLSNEFKSKFEKQFINLKPDNLSPRDNRQRENILVIQTISQPTPIAQGKWKVEIFANQLIFSNSDNLGKSIPFNKQVLIKAVDQPVISPPDNPTPWHLTAYRLGEARLQIYNICGIEDKKCF